MGDEPCTFLSFSPALTQPPPLTSPSPRRLSGISRALVWGLGLALTLAALAKAARTGPVMAPPTPATPTRTWSQGTYIWNSQALLNPALRSSELSRLKSAGMTHLLVGLTGAQVAAGVDTERALQQLLSAAHGEGLRVSLLLGDPEWILPQGRQSLLDLIHRYRRIGFDGLHLDLEVEQLGWPVPPERLQHWLATLQAVQQASPWALSISSHPRWFEAGRGSSGEPNQPCIPCELRNLQAVSLMIYQRQPERVAERSRAIAQRWPQLHFRLAQSVEAQLPVQESWHGHSSQQLQQQVRRWQQQLEPHGVSGLDWQDWSQYPKGN